jgi:hypothetical protein
MNDWIGLPEIIDENVHYSIIYKTTNLVTGISYIGKCQLWSKITKPPLKGKKRKRKIIKISDYLNYYGSSEQLKKDLELYGKENFTREVLDIASCKWESAILELLWQIHYNVITSDEFYNGILNVRIPKCPKHLKEKYKNLSMTFKFN